jgi:UDP-N-acetylmuramyl pentapeptide phosphotransferase/UDP-N-acetylglucosamine-1-phosphate transferase
LPNYPGIKESYLSYVWPFVLGGGIVAVTGLIDDIMELGAKSKLVGQIAGACVIWFLTTSHFDNFKIPFGGPLLVFPDWLSFIATIFWILAITNAVNLIDGLDGLASGVSIISLTTMGLVAYFFLGTTNVYLPITIFVLVLPLLAFSLIISHLPLFILGHRCFILGIHDFSLVLARLEKCDSCGCRHTDADFGCTIDRHGGGYDPSQAQWR